MKSPKADPTPDRPSGFCEFYDRLCLLHLLKCLLQISDEIVRIFKTDREADQPGGDSGGFQLFLGIRRTGHGRGVLNERLRRAERDRQCCNFHAVGDDCCFLSPTLDDEADHTAEGAHLLFGDFMTASTLSFFSRYRAIFMALAQWRSMRTGSV